MKYETPKLTALTPAIDAVQASKDTQVTGELQYEEIHAAYVDWE